MKLEIIPTLLMVAACSYVPEPKTIECMNEVDKKTDAEAAEMCPGSWVDCEHASSISAKRREGYNACFSEERK